MFMAEEIFISSAVQKGRFKVILYSIKIRKDNELTTKNMSTYPVAIE